MSLPSIDELNPLGKYSVTLSKHFIDVMSGVMTRVGSLPCCIVAFQAFEGSKDPYGITSGSLLSENSSRIYCLFMASIIICVPVFV
jgi:hypothetical protein